jgi:hypothetical protein
MRDRNKLYPREAFMRSPVELLTKESPRQIIFEDFKIELPIKGGWGYGFSNACVIDKSDPSLNPNMPFNGVSIEYLFVEKRIYEEMIIFREKTEKFSGIRWSLIKQELQFYQAKPFDVLYFDVIGFSDAVWNELVIGFEEIQKSKNLEMLSELEAYRESKAYHFERKFYFDISSFY